MIFPPTVVYPAHSVCDQSLRPLVTPGEREASKYEDQYWQQGGVCQSELFRDKTLSSVLV